MSEQSVAHATDALAPSALDDLLGEPTPSAE